VAPCAYSLAHRGLGPRFRRPGVTARSRTHSRPSAQELRCAGRAGAVELRAPRRRLLKRAEAAHGRTDDSSRAPARAPPPAASGDSERSRRSLATCDSRVLTTSYGAAGLDGAELLDFPVRDDGTGRELRAGDGRHRYRRRGPLSAVLAGVSEATRALAGVGRQLNQATQIARYVEAGHDSAIVTRAGERQMMIEQLL
jgi:hypothetical protein